MLLVLGRRRPLLPQRGKCIDAASGTRDAKGPSRCSQSDPCAPATTVVDSDTEARPVLTELQQLQLQLKQAHWNVSGTLFYPLHLLLQEH